MNILLINGGQAFGHSNGLLNQTLHEVARDYLTSKGHTIQQTIIADEYIIDDEIVKLLWADCIIFQLPAWWMQLPWQVKKYMDEVYTAGHGKLYTNDGRTRSDPSKQYGSGGLLHEKKYMLSVTWNAPAVAFTESDNFFEGQGVDAVYFAFHKAHQFMGLTAFPTFMVNDVIKDPQIDRFIEEYKTHLSALF